MAGSPLKRARKQGVRLDDGRMIAFHFVPTSPSWLNAVESVFSKMTQQCIRRGVFYSIGDLLAAINIYLAEHNGPPKPFVWTKSAEAILA